MMAIKKLIIMLKNIFILFALTFCLTSVQAQINVRLENQTLDTWTMTITDSSMFLPNPITVILGPGGVYTNTHTLVAPVSFNATSAVGCALSTPVAFAPSGSNVYPVSGCATTTEIEINTVLSSPPPLLAGAFEAIAR